jgi:hypothetical protein
MSPTIDQAAVRELILTTENDDDVYRQTTQPIIKNLATKKAQGKYDREKAVRAFMYLAEAGARAYARQYGGGEQDWHTMFPVPVRRAAAVSWRDEFEKEYALGNYDELVPKKYQKKNEPLVPPGTRVQLHPATDAWMRGDRYGTVVKGRGTNKIAVKLDKSGRIGHFTLDYIIPLDEGHW